MAARAREVLVEGTDAPTSRHPWNKECRRISTIASYIREFARAQVMVAHAITARQGLRTLNEQREGEMIIVGAFSISLPIASERHVGLGKYVPPVIQTAFRKWLLIGGNQSIASWLLRRSLPHHLHSLGRIFRRLHCLINIYDFFRRHSKTPRETQRARVQKPAPFSSTSPASYAPAKRQTLIPYVPENPSILA